MSFDFAAQKPGACGSAQDEGHQMKILLCDDQAVIRDGLEMLLTLEKDFQVIGAAQDGAEAVELAAQKQPDLILMDLKMPAP